MNPNPAQLSPASSANPLFDEVARTIGPKPGRTLSPVTTLSRYLERAKTPPVPAQVAAADDAPLSSTDLTPEEQALVTDMGGAVARLLVAMLRADQASGRRA